MLGRLLAFLLICGLALPAMAMPLHCAPLPDCHAAATAQTHGRADAGASAMASAHHRAGPGTAMPAGMDHAGMGHASDARESAPAPTEPAAHHGAAMKDCLGCAALREPAAPLAAHMVLAGLPPATPALVALQGHPAVPETPPPRRLS
ncbi:hypothetical protein ACFOON_16605 [Novosphingobium piscinae]|uniref:DUF2946 domain-containing protein n=1 Tax=Novosphingobium piscinae TaxID=1507448 RepID=A0A7X1FYN2_9SPHN|nr:hypothetical protein [Novosphingobium piscinae]MBC2669411.1 hypothetical protein [Novosphingobium piscinae]